MAKSSIVSAAALALTTVAGLGAAHADMTYPNVLSLMNGDYATPAPSAPPVRGTVGKPVVTEASPFVLKNGQRVIARVHRSGKREWFTVIRPVD